MPGSTSRSSRAFSDVKIRPSMNLKKEKSDKANKVIPQVEVASLKVCSIGRGRSYFHLTNSHYILAFALEHFDALRVRSINS